MERTRFLQHYRVRVRSDGTPYEVDSDGATSYDAIDDRTGEPVTLKLIPADSIDPAAREQLGEQVSAAQKLRHVNIAKVLDFGREGDEFVYISEHLPGETLGAWVRSHGPMPVDAALRVAEQVVSVLSSASFHKLPFPSIQPEEIIVVPGQTPEGTWPLVKLTNFGLPLLKARPELHSTDSSTPEAAVAAEQVEQIAPAEESPPLTKDIRSEIASLGATLYFLLTGVALSTEALKRRPNLAKFPKSLRNLLARMLHPDPDKRPKDLVVLAEMIRECLLRTERRREFADRYGIPYRRTIPQPAEIRSARLVRAALVCAALLLIALLLAPVLLPGTIGKLIHGSRDTKDIGVLVGVPESSPRTAAQNAPMTAASPNASSQPAPAAVASQAPSAAIASQPATAGTLAQQQENTSPAAANQFTVNAAPGSNSPASQDLQQTQTSKPPAQAGVVEASPASSPPTVAQDSSEPETKTTDHAAGTQSSVTREPGSRSERKTAVVSSSRHTRGNSASSEDLPQRRNGSVRARVVGITSDGRLILRLPSGRTAFVAPDSEQGEGTSRRHRRASGGRGEMFGQPPQFEPDDFPND